jgi:hypothetical protein
MASNGKTSRISEIVQEWKPRVLFLAIGLVLGPFISGWFGWQVTAGTKETAVTDAVVSYRAGLCADRARSDSETTAEMLGDYSGRRKLAEKWAILPGEEKADSAVVRQCNSQLAKT